jgi:hypothetical protein
MLIGKDDVMHAAQRKPEDDVVAERALPELGI